MTPNDIEIMIHCHTSRAPHPRRGAPAVGESIAMLEDFGMIRFETSKSEPGYFTTTEKGAKYIEMLCQTPMPVQEWRDPRF